MADEETQKQIRSLEDRLVAFMAREFESVQRSLSALQRQVTLVAETTAALVRANQDGEREAGAIRDTHAGMQRAIEDLDRRLRRLEEKNGLGAKP